MRNNFGSPTSAFWNFVGLAVVILAVAMFRATNFKVEAANQKLEVNRSIEQVKKVLDDSEQSAKHLPKQAKSKFQSSIEQAREELEVTQQEILDEDYSEANPIEKIYEVN